MVPGHSRPLSCSHPSSCSKPGGGEAGFPRGTPKFLLLHLLETPWQQSGPVIAFEKTQPLALDMGRAFLTEGPSTGPSASTATSSCCTKAVSVFFRCWPLASGRPFSRPPACLPLPLPFDIPPGGPEAAVEAERGGEVLGGRRQGSFSLLSPLVWVSFPLPLWLYFWQDGSLLPKMITPKAASPSLEGCASPLSGVGWGWGGI